MGLNILHFIFVWPSDTAGKLRCIKLASEADHSVSSQIFLLGPLEIMPGINVREVFSVNINMNDATDTVTPGANSPEESESNKWSVTNLLLLTIALSLELHRIQDDKDVLNCMWEFYGTKQ